MPPHHFEFYNMKKHILYTFLILLFAGVSTLSFAGNPDRQGESGAGELLFNPWARSAGLHTMSTSSIMGVEAMRLNVAGLARITKSEVLIGNARLYGNAIGLNAIGFATKVGENGALGVSLNSVDFGEIAITTEDQPEGTGGFISPSFFNLGLGYAHTYENRVTVGVLVRLISEQLPTVTASGIAIDAGVQYVSGEKDNFKLGISLRNIGSPMKFGGQGLSQAVEAPTGGGAVFNLTVDQRAEEFELPTVLNLGLSYDFYFTDEVYLRALGNFTSNAFSRDQIGGGLELFLLDKFAVRGAYRFELDQAGIQSANLYSGLAFGASIDVPLSKAGATRFGVDYAFRATNTFSGSHNVAVKLTF